MEIEHDSSIPLSIPLPLSSELLHYYQKRIEKSEFDYEECIKKIDNCKINHEEHHKLSWELLLRMNEISQLQKQLSDAQMALFDERKQSLHLIAENDELKSRFPQIVTLCNVY